MNITVYLGAAETKDATFVQAVVELGKWIAESGNVLVYGGSRSGLMGVIADAALSTGAKVIGVEPQFFIDSDVQHKELTELIVTANMAERKTKMIELGDAFIAFPGGTGTLEEITEVMSHVVLEHLDEPCIIYNLNGYYDGLKLQLEHMIDTGLLDESRAENLRFANDLEEIKEILDR